MIARKSMLVVISTFTARILGWIYFFVLAKLWGNFTPRAIGVIGFAISFIELFNIISDLGFNAAHVKRISEGKNISECLATFTVIKIILTSLMIIIFLSIKTIFSIQFFDATTENAIFILLIYYIFLDFYQIAYFTFEGTREVVKRELMTIMQSVKTPLIIIIGLAGVSSENIKPLITWPEFLKPFQTYISIHTYGSLAMAYLISSVFIFITGFWLLRKYQFGKPNWGLFKGYIKFALPTVLLSTMHIISTNVDKVMLGYFWTSTEVGYYFSVQQFFQIILIISGSVGIVLFPSISEFHSKKDFVKIEKTTHLAERYISLSIMPIVVVVVVFSKQIINTMLNDSFLPASTLLSFLTIYAFIASLMIPYYSLIKGYDKPILLTIIGCIMFLINVVLNYLLIPQWGLLSSFGVYAHTGAGFATSISGFIGLIGYLLAAKKYTGFKLMQRYMPYHLFAGIIMGVSIYLINNFISLTRWYHLIIFSVLGLLVYLVVLYILKEFKKEDLNFFLKMFHIKSMVSYIKSELK
ncbi:MAG: flippase [Candidatus Thermoplasmatota archaeon]|nr:flippase [Candidatus Thermoplasmatota archaeon]